jgi:hypothetical protein
MIEAFALLLSCQLAGEILSHGFALPMPGPVVGLLILFAGLVIAQNFGRSPQRRSMTRRSDAPHKDCCSICRCSSFPQASASSIIWGF